MSDEITRIRADVAALQIAFSGLIGFLEEDHPMAGEAISALLVKVGKDSSSPELRDALLSLAETIE